MSSRVIDGRQSDLPEVSDRPSSGPGPAIPEVRLLAGAWPAVEPTAASPAVSRYRIVLSCSFDEQTPLPEPE
jgi:hypothetical protein